MIILLDVGNSRVKLGWQHPSMGREPTVHAISLQPLDALTGALAKWLDRLPVQPTSAMGVNVAGNVVAQALGKALEMVGWAALLGLAGHFPTAHPPLILATFGTATTIDTLSPDNIFQGGLILPGPALMRQSLAQGTANLPLADGASNDYPKHTLQAIATGVVAAQAGAVLRQCQIARKHFGVDPLLCVSGGGWLEVEVEVQRMMPDLKPTFLINPVLDGVARLATQPS